MYLPPGIPKMLGLRGHAGDFKKPIIDGEHRYDSLAALNDSAGYTFKQIVAYIRSNPENVFVSLEV